MIFDDDGRWDPHPGTTPFNRLERAVGALKLEIKHICDLADKYGIDRDTPRDGETWIEKAFKELYERRKAR